MAQPLPDGFPSEPITIIVADGPTTTDAILINTLAEAASDLSPVPITMVARDDFEAFGSWEAIRFMHDEEGGDEGYVQVVLSNPGGILDLHGVDIEGELGLTRDSFKEVIGLEERPYWIVQQVDAPWGSGWDAMVEYAIANPRAIRLLGSGPGAATDLTLAYYLRELGAGDIYNPDEWNFIPIGGIEQKVLAIAAGEGDLASTTIDSTLPHLQSGRMELILSTGARSIPEFPDVPSAADVGIENDPIPGSVKFVITKDTVPDCHIEWLYNVYRTAAETPEYVEARSAIPMSEPVLRSPEEMKALNDTTYDVMYDLAMDLGIHWTQLGQ